MVYVFNFKDFTFFESIEQTDQAIPLDEMFVSRVCFAAIVGDFGQIIVHSPLNLVVRSNEINIPFFYITNYPQFESCFDDIIYFYP